MSESSLPAKVAYEDVDDVIEAAARAKEQDAQYLSVEELQEVAAELDIPAELVAPAIVEVRRRREAQLEQDRVEAERRARLRRIGLASAAVLLFVGVVWALVVNGRMRRALEAVELQRSQVVNVLDRQTSTVRQWKTAPESADKQAELSGAENRVRVERRRYDQRVADYHEASSGFMAGFVVWIGDYPSELPMSSEVQGW